MNQRDRRMMGRAYGVLARTGRLRAQNPADIKTIALYHRELEPILRSVGFALLDLTAGDYDLASENLDRAESSLARALAA